MLDIVARPFSETTSITLGCATGGKTDVKLRAQLFSWSGFKDRLRSPKFGEKDGSYYIRGGDLSEPKRGDDYLKSAQLIILDGDSSMDPDTGEVIPGAPDITHVADVLRQHGWTFCAHTSHSYIPGELWKYRVIIPAKVNSPDELGGCVDFLINLLHAHGVFLCDVPENRRWSQPWYVSRVRSKQAGEDFIFIEHTENEFDVAAAIDWERRNKAWQETVEEVRRAPEQHSPPAPRSGGIQDYNDRASLSDVRSMLEGAGYRFGYYDKGNDSYRYMRPGSTTKTFGCVVFKGSQGHWCVYSHHGNADALSGKVFDPFALAATLHHGGDLKAAARALLKPSSIADQLRVASDYAPLELDNEMEEAPQETPPASLPFIAHDESKEKVRRRIELIPWGQLRDEPIRWLVKDIVPANSFCALYGRPGSYKSFVALYLASNIANGSDAFGKAVEQGSVVYIAAEGGAGLKRRRDAIIRKYNLGDDLPIYFIKAQLNLSSTLDDMNAVLEAIAALNVKPKLLIVDTFARVFHGEENSAKEVGESIAIFGHIQDTLGCGILLVHHAGKDTARGMRGSSALLGAVDLELECVKISEEGASQRVGKLTVTKQKDGEDGIELGYSMDVIQLSEIDPDYTSLALEPITGDALALAQSRPDRHAKALLREFVQLGSGQHAEGLHARLRRATDQGPDGHLERVGVADRKEGAGGPS